MKFFFKVEKKRGIFKFSLGKKWKQMGESSFFYRSDVKKEKRKNETEQKNFKDRGASLSFRECNFEVLQPQQPVDLLT